MPELVRPDGAVIAYAERGEGLPLLTLGPALGETLDQTQAPIAAAEAFVSEFRVIETDPRRWYARHAPATPPTSTDLAAHTLALLDAVDVRRALLFATGGGAAIALRLAVDAPDRIASVVLQAPAGVSSPDGLARFWEPFHEVIRAVRAGGVAAARGGEDGVVAGRAQRHGGALTEAAPLPGLFQDDLPAITVERFATLLVRLRDAYWPAGSPWFSASDDDLRRCPVPLLVLPGDDSMHPAAIAQRICEVAPAAHCLAAGWQVPAALPQATAAVLAFLREHTVRS